MGVCGWWWMVVVCGWSGAPAAKEGFWDSRSSPEQCLLEGGGRKPTCFVALRADFSLRENHSHPTKQRQPFTATAPHRHCVHRNHGHEEVPKRGLALSTAHGLRLSGCASVDLLPLLISDPAFSIIG
ncbi:hypothetical protein QBC36DRAFT_58179 [Triangularia setosa]|uniref:Secreted protein n=1 Tax=Triangularia setosa TaxID=2587417 RepID=A0AAN6W1S4_9PEZI|nr:hypothetical protein QBC36DRAFT_58179 [Podospora setosa]